MEHLQYLAKVFELYSVSHGRNLSWGVVWSETDSGNINQGNSGCSGLEKGESRGRLIWRSL